MLPSEDMAGVREIEEELKTQIFVGELADTSQEKEGAETKVSAI